MASAAPASKRKKAFIILSSVLVLLIVIRIILPFVVLHIANRQLADMKGYYGQIQDIDLALIRGAYKIDSMYLNKVDSVTGKQTPFFTAKVIDLSVEWKALWRGSIVGELTFQEPLIIFTKEKVEPSILIKDSTSFKRLFDDFMPLHVNRLEINNGIVKYKDEGSKPAVDIAMTNTYLLAQNLRNSYDSTIQLPAIIKATSEIYGGTLSFNMKLDPMAGSPTFDMNTELKNTNLVALNEFLQAYAKIDVNKGTFGLYAEVAAKEGKFIGYVKPLIKDLDILGKEDRGDNIFRKIWEGIAAGVGQVFKNQDKDQIATKIPFEGKIENLDTNVWYAVVNILKNAFVQALVPSIDREINLTSVDNAKEEKRTFLQKVFGKKDPQKKDKPKKGS